ncbi:MAG: tail fiber domain-containing protein, partial [bacterium]
PSDGTANGGQALKLDVEGAVGASTYCDENGENCQTILQLASGGSGGKFVDGTDPNNAVYTTGNVGIGTTDPTVKLHVVDNDTAYQTQFLIENKNAQIPNTYEYKGGYAWQKTAHNNWDGEPRFMMARSRGSIDAPTANQEGDYIGQIEFRAYDGGTLRRGASIRAQVDGTVAASNMPASLHFLTEAEGGSDPIERMVIKNNGNVGIGTTAPDETLHVNGSIKLATRIISDNEIYLNPNGSPSDGFKLIGEPTKSTLMGHRNELIIGTERENTASEDDVIFQYSDANKTFEWMRLDASTGNVGIGTSNPRGGLDIANDAAIPLVVERTNTNGGGFVWQDFMADGNHQWRINGDSSNGGGTANLKFSTIHDNGATVKPRLVLDPSGRIGINELTPTATLHVGATGGIRFDGLTVDATGGYLCHDSATGLVTHGASCAASDERLKKDITPVTNALEKITELQGVNYHWKDENRGTRMELGLVAQAVENIIPEVVDTASDDMGTKSIRYENLVALLIEGMKEQQAQIDAQQKIIERLEANIK